MDKDFRLRGDGGATFKLVDAAKVNNFTSIVLLVCVAITAVLSMGEVTFTIQNALSVSVICVVLFVVASLIYTSKYKEYEAKARESELYISTKAEYDKVVKTFQDKKLLNRLPDLCLRYIEEELVQYRAAILSSVCLNYDTYKENYLNKTRKELKALNLAPSVIKAIYKANKARGLRLDPQKLTTNFKQSFFRYSALTITSGARESIDTGVNTLSRLATTVLGGVVSVSVIINFSWQTLAQWAIRMLPLAVAAMSGAHQGTRNIEQTAIPHMRGQINILNTMLEWAHDMPTTTTNAVSVSEN